MKEENKYSYIKIFYWVYFRLQGFRKKQFWMLFIGMASVAALETIALSSIAFFVSSFTDPKMLLSSAYLDQFKRLVNFDILYSPENLILFSGLFMIFMITLKNGMKALLGYTMSRFSIEIEAYFGSKLLSGFLSLPYQWHLTRNTADLVLSIEWRNYLGRHFFQPCLRIFNSVLMVSIMLIILFCVQPLISFIVIVVIVATSIFIYKVIRAQIDKTVSNARDYQLEINKEATMAIHGIKDVKISQKEDLFVSKFLKKAVPLSKIFGVLGFLGQSPVLILETIGFGMLCVSVFMMLLWLDVSTAYATGAMAILGVTAWRALPAANEILGSITTIRNSLPYVSNLIDYFNQIEDHKKVVSSDVYRKIYNPSKSIVFKNSIQFENVSFAYQGNERLILDDVSFSINQGQTTGIIGTSGAGKSTMVDLLIGLLEPQRGLIFIDDKELTYHNRQNWLSILGYVAQSPYIYDGTLAENIAFGIDTSDIDRDRVKNCCEMASMDDFMNDLPNGIDSAIGERGIKLSGGQQQRVAIARALYNNPEVMIFDEATSSLDSKSERAIQQTIYSFKGRKTLIVIAHRLNTVENCDKIIWLEKGKIIMQGEAHFVIEKYKQAQSEKNDKSVNYA